MNEDQLLEKYKKNFLKGFVQGVAFGIGYGFFSICWNKYLRQILVVYLKVPVAITD